MSALQYKSGENTEIYVHIVAYSYVPSLGGNVPVSVEPFLVDNSVPTEDNIEWSVTRLQNNHSGGTSSMRDKHLKGWLA